MASSGTWLTCRSGCGCPRGLPAGRARMRRGSSLLAMAGMPAADAQSAGSRPVASGCCDHEAAHDTASGASASGSFELIGDLLDAGLDAGFVLVAAGSAGDAG